MELTSIARQLEAASDMIESLGMPILAAFLDSKGEQVKRVAVNMLLRARATRRHTTPTRSTASARVFAPQGGRVVAPLRDLCHQRVLAQCSKSDRQQLAVVDSRACTTECCPCLGSIISWIAAQLAAPAPTACICACSCRASSASWCAGFRSNTTCFTVPVKAYGALSS